MKIANMTAACELVVAPEPVDVPRGATLEQVWRGKSATKRVAIVPGLCGADGASGSAAINDVNL